MAKEGGHEWYQSKGLAFVNISADIKIFFKGPWPFKQQKTVLSGLTTLPGASLNQGASAVKNSVAESPICRFFIIPDEGAKKNKVHFSLNFRGF